MKIVQVLMGMLVGFYIGIRIFAFEGPFLLGAVVVLVGLAFSLLAQIIIHELGHLVFGLLSGYKFVSFRVLSFQLTKTDNGFTVHRFNIAGTGGQCLMDPPDLKDDKFPFKLYLAGGVVFNILTSIIFYGISRYSSVNASIVLDLFAIQGMFLGLSNLYPMTKPIQNDGYNIIYMSEEDERYLWVQLKINALLMNGKSLYDIDSSYFEYQYPVNSSLEATVAYFAVNRAEAELDFEKVEKICSDILNAEGEISEILVSVSKLSLFYKRVIHDEDAETFYEDTKDFRKSMPNEPMVIRCEYTYELLVNKDNYTAKIHKALFNRIRRHYPATMTIEAEQRLIDRADEVIMKEIYVI